LPPAVDVEAIKRQMGAMDEDSIEMLVMFTEMTQSLIKRIRA